jgi:hypothetical protein
VPDVIGLQAITFALGEIDRIPPADRASAIDRAGLGVREHAGHIHQAWLGVPLAEGLVDLLEDATRAVRVAETLGTEWRVAVDRWVAPPVDAFVESLLAREFAGDLFVAPPGTLLFRGSPAAYASGWLGDITFSAELDTAECAPQRQVYRQADGAGRPSRDVVRRLVDDLPAGQPLLLPVIEGGRVVRRFSDQDTAARRRSQETAIGVAGLGVVFGD